MWRSLFFSAFVESALGKLAEEVQEQQRLAEAVGGLHQLQPVLLQVPPGEADGRVCPVSVYPPVGLEGSQLGVECQTFVP